MNDGQIHVRIWLRMVKLIYIYIHRYSSLDIHYNNDDGSKMISNVRMKAICLIKHLMLYWHIAILISMIHNVG